MRYVGGGAKEEGCVFCNRLAAENDVEALVLHRSERVFAILNLFPYNTGHLMLVPNAHVASPEEAPAGALADLTVLLRPTLRALRRALGCQGFNVGFNVGAVAGAGVADHLHQHVVPRWTGDANFMPIIASTMVMPELIPVTYAKVRAELEREFRQWREETEPTLAQFGDQRSDADNTATALAGGNAGKDSILVPPNTVTAVVLTRDLASVLVVDREAQVGLPTAEARDVEPLWRAALRAVGEISGGVELAGWAGQRRAELGGQLALTFLTFGRQPALAAGSSRWIETTHAAEVFASGDDRATLQFALANLAPGVAAP
jgi:ATP adenylyltransferase